MTDREALYGLFNVPGVDFWITGNGDSDTVRIRVRWHDCCRQDLAQRLNCGESNLEIRANLVAGLEEVFGYVRDITGESIATRGVLAESRPAPARRER